ncbi:MAG: LamG-like jellyroll fold domain-containing protein, partial [Bacteroidota bacterium]
GGSSVRNVTLGHNSDGTSYWYQSRIRTQNATTSDRNGLPLQDYTSGSRTSTAVHHVALTLSYDAGSSTATETFYLNGQLVGSTTRSGDLNSTWTGFPLVLGNEDGDDRPWLGTFYLAAIYSRGLSATEVMDNFQAGYGGGTNTPPAAPQSLSATAQGFDQVDLDWPDNIEQDFGSYSLYRSSSAGFTPDVNTLIAENLTESSYSDTGLLGSTTYYYVVIAKDQAGQASPPSTETSVTTDVAPPMRVTQDLQVLYTFQEGSGSTVSDVSGVSAAMDLTIETPANVTWPVAGGLEITTATRVTSNGGADKINNAVIASNEITLEAWVEPASVQQDGPARMLSISGSSSTRNITLGQDFDGSGYYYAARVRTNDASTDLNGLLNGESFDHPERYASPVIQHVVYTRKADGIEKIYVDGAEVATGTRPGDFSNWAAHSLLLGNEEGAERPWLGTYYLVSAYNRALSLAEVQQNYAMGYPTTTPSIPGSLETDSLALVALYNSMLGAAMSIGSILGPAGAA